jgi:hypothetical protein
MASLSTRFLNLHASSQRGHRESLSIITLNTSSKYTKYRKESKVQTIKRSILSLRSNLERFISKTRQKGAHLHLTASPASSSLVAANLVAASLHPIKASTIPHSLRLIFLTLELARAVRRNFAKDFMYSNKRIFLNASARNYE